VTPNRLHATYLNHHHQIHNAPRQLNFNPMMPIMPGSLNLDQSDSQQDPFLLPTAQTWTSFLNPFSNNNVNNNNNNRTNNNNNPSMQSGESQDDPLDRHVRKILVPRVSGTNGNIEVRNVSIVYPFFAHH